MTREAEFRAVARGGKRFRTEHLDLRAASSPVLHPRVGLIVPKHKKTSVARNRLKRVLREVVRRHVLPSIGPVDLVIRALPGAYDASSAALRSEVEKGSAHLSSMLCG